MRKCIRETDFLHDSKEGIIGVNLGWDFVAEHENGIDGIKRDFGLGLEKSLGFEKRRNTQVPGNLTFIDEGSAALFSGGYLDYDSIRSLLKNDLKLTTRVMTRINPARLTSVDKKLDITAAWDWDSFGVAVSQEHHGVLKNIYDAILNKNAIIMLGGSSGPFSNHGLLLIDYAKINQEERDSFAEKERAYIEEQNKFREMEKQSRVFDLLKDKQKGFYYLQIDRLDDKGIPMWWLNPREQLRYNAGWYTTEQLKQWAEDKGPVIKKSN